MAKKTITRVTKGGIIIDGNTLEMRIPKNVVEIFKGEPRFIFKRAEWFGIHPVPIDMLSRELHNMDKDYMFIAVPREMMK